MLRSHSGDQRTVLLGYMFAVHVCFQPTYPTPSGGTTQCGLCMRRVMMRVVLWEMIRLTVAYEGIHEATILMLIILRGDNFHVVDLTVL